MRIWIKEYQKNKVLRDIVVENNAADTRTHKILQSLDEMSKAWDIDHPIWLDKNIKEFSDISQTRFNSDNFISGIASDYIEITVIEED